MASLGIGNTEEDYLNSELQKNPDPQYRQKIMQQLRRISSAPRATSSADTAPRGPGLMDRLKMFNQAYADSAGNNMMGNYGKSLRNIYGGQPSKRDVRDGTLFESSLVAPAASGALGAAAMGMSAGLGATAGGTLGLGALGAASYGQDMGNAYNLYKSRLSQNDQDLYSKHMQDSHDAFLKDFNQQMVNYKK